MRIFDTTENVYNPVDAIIKHGFAVIQAPRPLSLNMLVE